MTVRTGKRMVLLAGALILIALGLELYLDLTRPGRAIDYVALAAPLAFVAVLAAIWGRYKRLEAEHGADYVQTSSARARGVLIAAAAVAAVLGVVAGYLLATR